MPYARAHCKFFLSFVLLPIHLLAHSNFLASNLRNHHATRLGRSRSRNTSHCGYTLTVLGVLGLSIPAQEYDLERAICTQGHPHARVSSKFLFFILYTHCHPHIASTISYLFLYFFIFAFCLYSFVSAGVLCATHPHIASTVSLSKFLFCLFVLFCLYSSVSHARTHACTPAISLHTRPCQH